MKMPYAIGFSTLALLGMTTAASAEAVCAADQPCVASVGINKSRQLFAVIRNATEYDVMNVRWSRPGRQGPQKEYRAKDGPILVFTSTTKGVTYTVSAQGCRKRAIASSRCSGWDHGSVTAK